MTIKAVTMQYGTEVWAGDHMLACITSETEQAATDKFIALCKASEGRLTEMGIQYDRCVAMNKANPNGGKFYPIFSQREREVSRLCKLAGIIDT